MPAIAFCGTETMATGGCSVTIAGLVVCAILIGLGNFLVVLDTTIANAERMATGGK